MQCIPNAIIVYSKPWAILSKSHYYHIYIEWYNSIT